MVNKQDPDGWARLRFTIIGQLLAAPPARGQLQGQLKALAQKTWCHPVNGTAVCFSFATLERWYYAARHAKDPVAALRRQAREDAGAFRGLSAALIQALSTQYQAHPGWTVQLHYDNLQAAAEQAPALRPVSSYSTIRRYMRARGYHRKRMPKRNSPGGRQAEARLERLEVRSYEAEYVQGLWHADFHHGSRKVVTAEGVWETPLLLCFMDDHSRLVCHLQWYRGETAEILVHGLSQALQKRGLPRALMVDYVARHIINLMCPLPLCGKWPRKALKKGRSSRLWPHNTYRDCSHLSSDRSSRQIGFSWDVGPA